MRILTIILMSVLAVTTLPGCGMYNAFQMRDEQVKAAWTSVLSVYQKRADLIGNLVNTVQGYAAHEKDVLSEVTSTRASASKSALPKDATPEQIAQFVEAQKALGAGLGRLLAIAEAYPNLKANENFKDLQLQLKEVETQATAARARYIREVQAYNVNVRSFPSNLVAWFFGYTVKPQLEFDNEIDLKNSPKVNFGGK